MCHTINRPTLQIYRGLHILVDILATAHLALVADAPAGVTLQLDTEPAVCVAVIPLSTETAGLRRRGCCRRDLVAPRTPPLAHRLPVLVAVGVRAHRTSLRTCCLPAIIVVDIRAPLQSSVGQPIYRGFTCRRRYQAEVRCKASAASLVELKAMVVQVANVGYTVRQAERFVV